MKRITFLLILFAGSLQAATYYVSTNGNDSASGAVDQPFLTIAKAFSVAYPTDTIKLGAGYYDEAATSVRDGTNGGRIVLDGQNLATVRRVSIGHAYHSVINCTVSGHTTPYQWLVYLNRGAHYSVVSNNFVDAALALNVEGIYFRPSTDKPFGTDYASNCTVISNRITRLFGTTGISVNGTNNVIKGNYIYDMAQCDFFRLWGETNLITSNVCSNNYPADGTGNHIDFVQTFGLNLGQGSRGHRIEYNRVMQIIGGQLTQLEGNGIPEIGEWTFANNVFVEVYRQASCTIPDIKYFNNTFYRCHWENNALTFGSREYSELWDGTPGNVTNRAHGATVVGNMFVDCAYDALNYKNRGWYTIPTTLTNCYADYNFVSRTNGGVTAGSVPIDPGPSDWDPYKFYEPNGINGGVHGFASVTNHDFRLRPISPAIDVGTNISSASLDMDGFARIMGSQCDMGAYEFDPSLKLRLDFDQGFVDLPYVEDVSGSTNHGYHGIPTNYITATEGIRSLGGYWQTNRVMSGGGSVWYPASQYLYITNLAGIDYMTNATFTFWAKLKDKGVYKNALVFGNGYNPQYATGTSNTWRIGTDSTGTEMRFNLYNESGTPSSGNTQLTWPTVGSADWPDAKHFALVFDRAGGQVYGYLDGVLVTNTTILSGMEYLKIYNGNPNWLAIGTWPHNSTYVWGGTYPNDNYVYGMLDDIRIYDRALSSNEVYAVYTAQGFTGSDEVTPPPQPEPTPGGKGRWRMGRGLIRGKIR